MKTKQFMIGAINWYQEAFSYRLSPCRFYPSCSAYAKEAVEIYGPWTGGCLAVRRLGRCRPFGSSGYDPVPENNCCVEHSQLAKAINEHV